MKPIFFSFLLLLTGFVYGQQDTVVVEDYVKILISTSTEGEIEPLTNLSNKNKVGFFLSTEKEGMIRICNESELIGWVNGRLVFSFAGCELFEPSFFFQFSESDTVFVSFSTSTFSGFRCERVVFDTFQVVKEEGPEPRKVRDHFKEFNIIAISLLLLFFALFAIGYPSRLNFFINKTYSLKSTSYQFVGTSFFSRPNVLMTVILSLGISFEMIYIGFQTQMFFYDPSRQLGSYLSNWIYITIWILAFFVVKRILIQIIANLFKMRKLRDWQLFDLVNFAGYFTMILFIIILWDFVIKAPGESWINDYFSNYFLVVLILFELWFVVKFVTNSSYRKLLIISYLCATEIIPSIFFIEWFFK